MASERGAKKLFDRGFESIDELKARCKAETGLERRSSRSSRAARRRRPQAQSDGGHALQERAAFRSARDRARHAARWPFLRSAAWRPRRGSHQGRSRRGRAIRCGYGDARRRTASRSGGRSSVATRNRSRSTFVSSEGQELLRELVGKADFLLENFRPGTLEKWGCGWERALADQSAAHHDPCLRVRADRSLCEARRLRRQSARRWAACATSSAIRARRPRAWASASATRWRRRLPVSARCPRCTIARRPGAGR